MYSVKNRRLFKLPVICILISLVVPAVSQDLELIGKEKNPFKVSGSLSANQIFYGVSGIESRRQPYNYFLSGNVNFSLYGWSVPLSFTYSNQQAAFRQPFNQYGIQPTYKWIKTYIGYNSLTFSPYTLNGHIFLGTGVELIPPGVFHFSAMYGRLQQAVKEDTSNASVVPAFKRMGFGMKMGVGKNGDFFDIIVFKAQDQINSLKEVPEYSDVLPSDNLVLGAIWNKKLGKRVTFTGEYATSAFTRDTRSERTSEGNPGIFKIAKPLFESKISSSYFDAYKTNINYSGNGFSFGIGYEHIDPNYITHGAYYFNNDLENITFNTTKRLFKGKANIAANLGTQRNNLENQKVSTMRRFISAFNVMYAPSPRLNLSGGYSNFQTFTRIRTEFEKINQLTPYNSLDTLNFVQLTQSANFSASYMLSNPTKKEVRQNLMINITHQVAGNSYGTSSIAAGTKFYNGNCAYSLTFVPENLSLTSAINVNQSELESASTLMVGPTVTVTKGFAENKVKSSASTSWNKAYANGIGGTRVLNVRLGGTYVLKKKHNISLNLITLNRNAVSDTQPKFTEYTGTVGYSYSF